MDKENIAVENVPAKKKRRLSLCLNKKRFGESVIIYHAHQAITLQPVTPPLLPAPVQSTRFNDSAVRKKVN